MKEEIRPLSGRTVIRNGRVFLEDGRFHRRDLWIADGRIRAVTKPGEAPAWIGEQMHPAKDASPGDRTVDATGCMVLPGLVDIHTHGALGCDFSDASAEELHRYAAYEASIGVTSFCPTSMSLPREQLLRVFAAGAEAAGRQAALRRSPGGHSALKEARIPGFHMEGPFLSPAKKGAQKETDILLPDEALFKACQEASGGRIRLLTLAPELSGATALIRALRGEVTVSLGHTCADYDTAKAAFADGASHVTHLWNAMPPFSHRAPGPVGAAADSAGVTVELIADGIHVHDSAIRAAFAMFPGRVALISDSMRATGLPDGDYELGGQPVRVQGAVAALADGTLAGSVTNLFDALRHAVAAGIPPEEAIAAATSVPAACIGASAVIGSIAVGKNADLLLADETLGLRRVMIGGDFLQG